MTAAADDLVDPVVEFRRHLPTNAQRSLNLTQAVVALVHAAVRNHGWTPAQLARECSRDIPADSANPGALVTYRLRENARHPPPNAPTRRRPALPLCGQCEDGWLVDARTKLPVRRCDCRKATP